MSDKQKQKPDKWYLPGILYDGILERPLVGIRKKVRTYVAEFGLSPLLDICCGPGTQLGVLAQAGQRARSSDDLVQVGLDINLRMMKYAAARRSTVPFVCGDAVCLPFREGLFKGALLSFALHEQEPEVRRRILAAAKRVLAPGGCLILVDFEDPWNPASRRAYAYTSVIERFAGARHFRLNRDFFRRGGLRALLAENGITEILRHDIAAGTCAIVVAAPNA